ncbi:MAG: hypothetical protein ABIP30_00385 [Ferruginibacter sp.]
MKSLLSSIAFLSIFIACKSNTTNSTDTTRSEKNIANATAITSDGGGDCASLLLFKEGAVINGHTLDAQGKETSTSVTTITKVSNVSGAEVSEVEIKTHSATLADYKSTGKYMCDGKMLSYDMSGFLASLQKKGTKIETPVVQFPINVSEGEALPDASYSFTTTMGTKSMKVTCVIKNRKVEAKESITTPAGTFEAYKISNDVDSKMEMDGTDEKMKTMMEAMKDKMPKIHYVMWYVPSVTVVKMEMYTGDKISSTSEITSIK